MVLDPIAKRSFDAAHGHGWDVLVGVDEVGRGCLAGPVVSAAVALRADADLPGVDDSKALRRDERQLQAGEIRRASRVIAFAFVSAARIDATDIRQASLTSMRIAVRRAERILRARGECPAPERVLVLVDGRDAIPGIGWAQRAIIAGDASSLVIAAASIVAKTVRDGLMTRLAGDLPGYGFERHMGYATPEHLDAIDRLGPSRWHRTSFSPFRLTQLSL